MLMIGGATRNVGKTHLSINIIKKFSDKYNIVGLKVKTIRDNDSFFHGKDKNPLKDDKYRIIEEKDTLSDEDSSKMLKAGAKKVFRIKVKNQYICEAYEKFKNIISDYDMIICESNSLRSEIEPGVFLMIKSMFINTMKPSALEMQKYADKIIFTDGKKHNFDIDSLLFSNKKWTIDQKSNN